MINKVKSCGITETDKGWRNRAPPWCMGKPTADEPGAIPGFIWKIAIVNKAVAFCCEKKPNMKLKIFEAVLKNNNALPFDDAHILFNGLDLYRFITAKSVYSKKTCIFFFIYCQIKCIHVTYLCQIIRVFSFQHTRKICIIVMKRFNHAEKKAL